MNYPLISEYIEAIKSAEDNFKVLRFLSPVLGEDGMPIMSVGDSSVVFKMQDVEDGCFFAVKCFLKEQSGRSENYNLITCKLKDVFSNYFVKLKYFEKELYVDTKYSSENTFPVLLMEWVEGKELCAFLYDNMNDVVSLQRLCYNFSIFSYWLLQQPFAHGNLNSENILIKKDGSIVLVDYDAMYVPAMKGQKHRELGSPGFCHPQRNENIFDEHIDDFPIVLILLSIKAITIRPDLIRLYCTKESLLFLKSDLQHLGKTKVWDDLLEMINDKEFCQLYGSFMMAYADGDLKSVSLSCIVQKNPFYNISSSDFEIENGWCYLTKSRDLLINKRWIYGPNNEQGRVVEHRVRKLSNKYKEMAFQCFLKAAKQGSAKAQYALGVYFDFYCDDNSVQELAAEYYLIAAEHGYPLAQEMVGHMYSNGHHKIYVRFPFRYDFNNTIPQNKKNAVLWYSLAAEQGYASAQYSLANCYFSGEGTFQSYEKAIDLYTISALQGNPSAQTALGNCYAEGIGVPVKWSTAALWFAKAAEQGEDESIAKLAMCYEKGLGVEKDINKSKELLKKLSFEYR